jgi:hypothetical protein
MTGNLGKGKHILTLLPAALIERTTNNYEQIENLWPSVRQLCRGSPTRCWAATLSGPRFRCDDFSTPKTTLKSSKVIGRRLVTSFAFETFLCHSDVALQNVALAFRNTNTYDVLKVLPEVGWRMKKTFFQVTLSRPRWHCLDSAVQVTLFPLSGD